MTPDYYKGPLKALFTDDIPLIDVRAPVEFEQGAYPNAVNIPILDNGQRHEVGTCYKGRGRAEAMELGHNLVSGADKSAKLAKWLKTIEDSPDAVIYCFRGGLRSQITQNWLNKEGTNIPIIEGGYKRLRNYLIEYLEAEVDRNSFLVISGNTGSGKTDVLNRLSAAGNKAIDLEGLANHRGSAFGQYSTPQPSQIDFENALSIQFIKEESKASSYMLLEDESRAIGSIRVPLILFEKKKQSHIFVLRIPREERVKLILRDYVVAMWSNFKDLDNPCERFFEYYKGPFDRIEKRLGGLMYKECLIDLKNAVDLFEKEGSFEGHKAWIEKLLIYYYDPLYEKGLAKKKDFIVGEGSEAELVEFLNSGKVLPSLTVP